MRIDKCNAGVGDAAPCSLRAQATLTVREFLADYAGARVLYPYFTDDQGEYIGNNGDILIMKGVERLFADYDIEVVEQAEKADLVVMCGGGGLREKGRWVRGIFRDCCQGWPHLPLCVLPSSFEFPNLPLAKEIGDRKAPVTLFCREPYSYRHLTNDHALPSCCRVELDHDLAFELADTPWIKALAARASRHVLIVERQDYEHPSAAPVKKARARRRMKRWTKRLVPLRVKPLVWRALHRAQEARPTSFRRGCEALIESDYSQFSNLPRKVADISNRNFGSVETFADCIADASVVMSTRLHVGVMGAMLGRPTILFEGSYHKIRGIYEFSLKHLKHVRLMTINELNG